LPGSKTPYAQKILGSDELLKLQGIVTRTQGQLNQGIDKKTLMTLEETFNNFTMQLWNIKTRCPML
jgi:hypothetical protein